MSSLPRGQELYVTMDQLVTAVQELTVDVTTRETLELWEQEVRAAEQDLATCQDDTLRPELMTNLLIARERLAACQK